MFSVDRIIEAQRVIDQYPFSATDLMARALYQHLSYDAINGTECPKCSSTETYESEKIDVEGQQIEFLACGDCEKSVCVFSRGFLQLSLIHI